MDIFIRALEGAMTMNQNNRSPLGEPFPFGIDENPSIMKLISAGIALGRSKTNAAMDVRFAVVDLPLNRDAVRKLLPWGMRLSDPPMGRIFVAHYGQATYSAPYSEGRPPCHGQHPSG